MRFSGSMRSRLDNTRKPSAEVITRPSAAGDSAVREADGDDAEAAVGAPTDISTHDNTDAATIPKPFFLASDMFNPPKDRR
jgi:hypothetical protein